jgi:pentatricopeptide repeat protein
MVSSKVLQRTTNEIVEHYEASRFQKALSVYIDFTLSHPKDGLSYETFKLALVSAKRIRDYSNAVRIYKQWIKAKKNINCALVWNVMISVYLRMDQVEQAVEIFENFDSSNIKRTFHSFTALIDELCKRGDVQAALKYYGMLCDAGFRPDARMFSCFITAYVRKHDLDNALTQFQHMTQDFQLEPETCAIELLVQASCDKGSLEQLAKLIDGLKLFKSNLNSSQLLSIIDKFCKFGRVDLARDVSHTLKVDPCSSVYKEVVMHFCKLRHLSVALSLIADLHASDLAWKPQDYESVFKIALKNCKSPAEAEDFFNSLRRIDVTPTPEMVKLLLKEFEQNGMLLEAQSLKTQLLRQGVDADPKFPKKAAFLDESKINFSTADQRFDPSIDTSLQEALIFLENSVKSSLSLGRQLVFKYIGDGQMENAERLIKTIQKKESQMMKVGLDSLLECYCKTCSVSLVERVLVRMDDIGMQPSIPSIHYLIQCYCDSGYLDRALRVIQVCENSEVKLKISAYNSIIREHCKRGAVLDSMTIVSKLKRVGLKATFDTVRMIIETCCVLRLGSELEVVLQLFHLEGIPIDVESCNLCFQRFPEKDWNNFKFMPRIAGEEEVHLQKQRELQPETEAATHVGVPSQAPKMKWRSLFK